MSGNKILSRNQTIESIDSKAIAAHEIMDNGFF